GGQNFLSGFLGAPVGRAADRSQRYAQMMLEGFLLIVLSGAMYYASFAAQEMLLRYIFVSLGSLFLGMGLAFYHPIGGAILQIAYGRDEAPKALGINGSMGSLGRALAPYVMVMLFSLLGVKGGIGALSAFTLALSLVTYYGLRDIKYERPTEPQGERQEGSLSPYLYMLIPLTAIVFVRSMFIAGVQLFAPNYLYLSYRSHELVGIFLTISYATAIVGQPYFGRLTSEKGGRYVVIMTTIFSTLFYVAFLLVREIYLSLTLFAAFAFFAFSGFPNLIGYVSQVVDRKVLARANGIVWSYGNMLGGALGMIIGGPIAGYYGFRGAMILYAVLAVISSIMLISLPKERSSSN
ncbi:MAG: MFS transporter, partial [Nitrososphaeria archaeon]